LRTIDDPAQPAARVDVPDGDRVPLAEGARLTYRRAFNRPTGLESGDKVWLSIESYAARSICVSLNDQSVYQTDTAQSIRIDLTARLESSNQLEIQLAGKALGESVRVEAGLDGEVSLQIEPRP
jgi:hypothetical protein